MKKIFTLCVLMALVCVKGWGQNITNYSFAATSGTYTAITGSTNIFAPSTTASDDGVSSAIALPFDFYMNGIRYTYFAACINGWMRLGQNSSVSSSSPSSLTSTYTNALNSTSNTQLIAPMWDDLYQLGNSSDKVHYVVTGTAPNRVLTVEWFNIKRNGSTGASQNFQVSLYETTGKIVFAYGTCATPTSTSASVGFTDATGGSGHFLSVNGFSTTSTVSSTTASDAITTTAPSGLTYTFTPPAVSAPTGLTFSSVGLSTETLNWTAPSPATGVLKYDIYYSTDNSTFTYAGTTTVGTNTYTATGLTPSTTYYWKVYSQSEGALSTALSGSQVTGSCAAGLSGTKTVGVGSDYATLTAAIAAINTNGVASNLVLELSSTYTSTSETFPITLGNVTCLTSGVSVTIRPATGVTPTITSANATATINISGGKYWIIDGRAGGTGSTPALTISNSSTSSGAAVQFINDAQNNTVQYSTVTSAYVSGTSGIINFGTATSAGNNNNVIANNTLNGGGTVAAGIYSLGSSSFPNISNTISNNNIANIFAAGTTTSAIRLGLYNSSWTITGNKIYQDATRTVTSGITIRSIFIESATGGYTITNNIIGFGNTSGTGTSTFLSTVAARFAGMDLSLSTSTISSIQGNTIGGIALTTASTASTTYGIFTGIYIQSGSVNIGTTTANIIGAASGTGNISVVSTASGVAINGIYASSSGTVAIQNNTISSIATNSAAGIGFSFYGVYTLGSGAFTVSGNTLGANGTSDAIRIGTNSQTTSSVSLYSMYLTNTGAQTVSNNNLYNITAYSTSTSTILYGIYSTGGAASSSVTGNTVSGLTTSSTATSGTFSVLGIYAVAGGTSMSVSQNTVYTLTNTNTTVASTLGGIYLSSAYTGGTVSRNKIYDITSSSTTTPTLAGLYISTGGWIVSNNMISVTNGNNALAATLYGIWTAASSTYTDNFYYNSIYIGGAGAGTAVSYGFLRSSNATVTIQDNIFANVRTGSTGNQYAIGNTYTTPATGWTSDYNVLNAPTTTAVGLWNATVYSFADWKTNTTQDAHSSSGIPVTFVAPATGDLHLNMGTTATPIESGGVAVSSITIDYDGEIRPNGTAPDIGADEFVGVPQDLVAPTIAVSSTTSCGATATVVTATITDASGVPTTLLSTSLPVLYYRTTTSGTFTAVQGVYTTGNQYTFTFTSGATAGTTIYYYIAAQDNVGNVGVFPSTGASGLTTNPPAASTPPTTPATILVSYNLNGTYTVGASGQFTTLTAAIAAYNGACGISGNVVFSLTDASYSTGETFPIVVNSNALNTNNYTLTIKPASGVTPTITGSNATALIDINGGDYVVIDGSNTIGGITKDLTLSNTSTSGATVRFINDATNNTIKNTVLKGVTTSITNAVVFLSTTTGTTGNDNNTIQNNDITAGATAPAYGIYNSGTTTSTATKNSVIVIAGNNIYNFSNTGIYDAGGSVGINYSGNQIYEVTTQSTSLVGFNPHSTTIEGFTFNANRIYNLNTTSTGSVYGIYLYDILASSTLPGVITNNMVALSATAPLTMYGIYDNTATGEYYNIYYNTVSLTGTVSGASNSIGYYWSIASATDFRDNIISNTRAGGTGTHYAIRTNTTLANLTSNYNDLYVGIGTGDVFGYDGTASRTNLSAWQTATTKDANSISVLPLFTSATDLHLVANNPAISNLGVVITTVTTDYDGETRSSTPDMGADEFTACTPPTATASGNTPVCSGATLNLTGTTNAASGSTYAWTGPNSFTSSVQSPSITNVTTAAAGTYTFTVTTPDGCTASGTTTVVVNSTPSALTVTPTAATVCVSGIQPLTASGGTVSGTLAVGTSTTVNSTTSYPAPYTQYYGGAKHQMLIRASELTALGFTSGSSITSIAFNVTAVGASFTGSLLNFQINMGHTTSTVESSTAFLSAPSVVYGPVTQAIPTTSLPQTVTHTLTTPFVWNGTDNIVIQTSYSNNITGSSAYYVQMTQTDPGFVSTNWYRADGATAAAVLAAATPTSSGNARPNMILGTSAQAPITWSPTTNLYTDALATTAYTGTAAATVYSKPTAAITYTATATNGTCTSTGTAALTISNLAVAETHTNVSCNGSTNGYITATGSGGTTPYTYKLGTGTAQASGTFTGLAAGSYTITITDANGCTSTVSVTITQPTAVTINEPAHTDPICNNGTNGSITVAGGGGTTPYSYTVDGGTSQTSGVFNGLASGSHTFVVTDANGCTATNSYSLTNPAPIVVTAGNSGDVCAGGTISFTATGGTSYSWTGPNSFASALQNPSITNAQTTASGTYTVTVTDGSGCSNTASTSVVVNATIPVSVSLAASQNPVCSGTLVTFTATPTNGGTTPTYQFFVNGTLQTSTGNTFSYTPANNDVVSVTLTSSVNCASGPATDQVTMSVTASVPVSVTLAASQNPICSGTSVTYTATGTGGGTTPTYNFFVNNVSQQTGASNTYTYTPANNDQVKVVLTSNSTCATGNPATSPVITMTVNTTPTAPTVTAGGPTTFCAGGSVILTSSYTTGNTWSTGATTQSIVVTTGGSYTVTYNNGTCTSPVSATTVVTVNPLPATPTITAGGPTTFCAPGSVVLTSSAATAYQWNQNGTAIPGETNQTYTATATGNYSVTISNGTCSNTSVVTAVTVNPAPTVTANASCASVFANGVTTLTASGTGLTSYQWYSNGTNNSNSGGTIITGATSSTYTPPTTAAGLVYYYVIASNGTCPGTSNPVPVTVTSGPISGIYTISAASCDFKTITSAVTYLNTYGVGTGGVTFNVLAGYTETIASTITLTATGTSANPIIFQKSGTGANPKVTAYTSGTATQASTTIPTDGIWALSGSDYITIDGIDLAENSANTTAASLMEYGYGLFKADATNGAQNNTIKNCVITLSRTNTTAANANPNADGSIGIEVINALKATPNTALTTTTVASGNSNNKFYSNTIQSANQGIWLFGYGAGSAADGTDVGNDVGGTSAATGNTIINYGSTGSTAVAGVRTQQQYGLNVSYNIINNNNGSGVNGTNTLRGIYTNTAPGASETISFNTITLKGGGTTSQLAAIENAAGSTASSNTININSNTIQNSTYSTGTSATFYGILNSGSATTANINSNIIQNNTFTGATTAGTFYAISNAAANTTTNCNSNQILNNTIGTSGSLNSATLYGIYNSGASTNLNANSNTITGNTMANSYGSIYCIRGVTSVITVNGNTISNNTIPNSASSTSSLIYGYYNVSSPVTETVTNNTISNLTITGSSTATGHTIYGIYNVTASGVKTFSGNNINTLTFTSSSTGYASVVAIRNAYTSTSNIFKNVIHNLSSTGTTPTVSGIYLGSSTGTTYNVYNNLIGNLTTPQSTGFNLTGIYCGSTGTNINLYYNTIYLNGTSTGTGFASSAVYQSSTTPSVLLNNNILVNLSTATGTGLTTAFRRTTSTLTQYNSASNNNLFYAGTPSTSNLVFYDGTNSVQTMSAYKTLASPRESNSFSEIVSSTPGVFFQNLTGPATGTTTTFLHLVSGLTTQAESGGIAIAGITDDYDGQARPNNTTTNTPDVGADEFVGVPVDLTAPTITYTALANQCGGGARTLTATITDASGVPTSGTGLPILYWKVSTATTYTASQGTSLGSNQYQFSLGTGTVAGDVIQYYIVAQDNASTPNVGVSPAAGASGLTANPPAASTPPTTPSSYTNNALLSGNYTVGVGGNYTTLTAAVADYNSKCVNGAVTFNLINPATTPYNTTNGEIFPIVINANSGANATNTLTIKPATGVSPVITGAVSSGALLKLNAASFVTIDGSNTSGGTTRNLTITNSSTTSPVAVWVGSTGTAAGAKNNTIKNAVVTTGSNAATSYGIFAGSATTIGTAGDDNDNLTIQNDSLSQAYYGIYIAATSATGADDNVIISGNAMGSSVTASQIGKAGIYLAQVNSSNISNNKVFNIIGSTNTNPTGMIVSTGVANTVFNANNITGIRYTGTGGYGGKGMDINTGSASSNITISNNFISDILGDGWSSLTSDAIVGIRIGASATTGGINLYYNSVNLGSGTFAGSTSGTLSAALYVSSTSSAINLKDNIFSTNLVNSAVTAKTYAIYSAATSAAFTSIDNNDYYVSGTQGVLGNIGGTDQTTIAAIQTSFGSNTSSVSVDPVFTSAIDLHLQTTSTLESKGTPITGITTDIDGQIRNVTTPDIGADEYDAVLCAPGTGTTQGGTATYAGSAVCNSGSATITATGYAAGINVTYQWEYSNDNFATDIHDLTGQTTASSATATVSTTTYFRLREFCSSSNTTYYSTVAAVTVNNPLITGTTPGSRCGIGTVSLAATGSAGTTLNWYAGSTGGAPIGTGSPFTTPSISATTTYFVAASSGGSSYTLGKATTGVSDGSNATTGAYLIFTATQSLTLNSVVVYPYGTGAGTATIALQNSSGTTLQSAIINLPSASTSTTVAPAPVTANLGFNVPVGSNYRLVLTAVSGGVTGLYRDFTASFPYTVSGVASITDGSLSGTYYHFYNWSISTGCESARTAVIATVNTPPTVAINASQTSLCSPAPVTLTATSPNDPNYTYTWAAPISATGASQTATPTATTTYTVTAVDNSGGAFATCTATASVTISVNTPTTPTITASATRVCTATPVTLIASSGTSTYCTPTYTSASASGDYIANVTFAGINNTTGDVATDYTYYSALTANVTGGTSYALSLSAGTSFSQQFGVWIDYNQNGTFEASEFVFSTSTSAATATGNIIIPATAYNGVTRMRVVSRFSTAITSDQSCIIPSSFGEAEDYNVTITGGVTNPNAVTYLWSTGATTQSITVNPTATTTYTVTATNGSGCSATSTPTTVTVVSPLAGIYSVGSSNIAGEAGHYSTLTSAVADYNGLCLGGATTFALTDATYSTAETFPIVINENSNASATNTLTIKPAAGVTSTLITGSSATAIIKLNGADYVTIDGSNNGGTDHSLTIKNTSTNTASGIVWISSASATNGATFNTIKNSNITGNGTTVTAAAIDASSGTGFEINPEAANSNNTIANNIITSAQNALFLSGYATAPYDQNWTITGNTFGSTVANQKLGFRGMYLSNASGVTISSNTITGVEGTGSTLGVSLGGAISGANIFNNKITDVKSTLTTTGTYANAIRLNATTTASNVNVYNNFISDVTAYGAASVETNNGSGIYVYSGGGYNIYYNSISLATNQTGTAGRPSCIIISSNYPTTAGTLNIVDNILSNTETVGARYGIYVNNGTNAIFSTINNNDYYVPSGNIGFLTSARATLATWQTATAQDVNSVNINPLFTDATTDLHINLGNGALDNLGTPVTGITADIDAETRSTTTPDIGADEFSATACNGTSGGTVIYAGSNICTSGTATLTASGYPIGTSVTYQWEYSSDNFASDIHDLAGQTSVPTATTGTLTSTTYFRLRSTCTATSTIWYSISDTVRVVTPLVTSTTPATRCGNGTVTLTATGSTGNTLYWYNAATGGNLVASGASFTTPTLNTSTTYYVSASSGTVNETGPVSPATEGGTTGVQTINWNINFNILQAGTFQSVDVYPIASGETGTIYIYNSGGTLLKSVTFTTTVSGGNTPQTVPIGLQMTPGTGYQLYGAASSASNLAPASGITRNVTGASYPYTSASLSITGNGFDNTYYMGYYNWQFAGGCESARTAVTATVNPAPIVTIAPVSAEICRGSSATLVASSTTNPTGYTYTWTPGSLTGASQTISPTATTIYTVTAVDNTGGTYTGCTTTESATVTVDPVPGIVTVTPDTSAICANTIKKLTATGGKTTGTGTALTENFATGAPTWTKVNNSYGGDYPDSAAWKQHPDSYAYGSVTFRSNDHSEFFMSNSDQQGFDDINGNLTETILTSPGFSTQDYTTLNLSFYQYYRYWLTSDTAAVEVSTDKVNWTKVKDYASGAASVGTATNFNHATISLSSYIGFDSVYIRFRYKADWGYYWAIDNVVITGTQNVPAQFAWTPTAGLYTDAAATVPYAGGTYAATLYAKPDTTTSYIVSSTNSNNCSNSDTALVVVNALPTAAFGSPAYTTCYGTAATLALTGTPNSTVTYRIGTSSTNYTATIGAGGTGSIFTDASAGSSTLTTSINYTLISVTKDSTSCTSTISGLTTLTIEATPIISISGTPNQSVCKNSTVSSVTYTAAGSATSLHVINTGGLSVSGNNSATVTVSGATATSVTYSVITVGSSSCSPDTVTGTITVYPYITWTGATSTNWSIGSNWCSGTVPTATDSVIIPALPDVPREPMLNANTSVGGLNILAGATVDMNGNDFTTGAVTGAGMIIGSLPSTMTTTATGTVNFDATNNTIKNLVVSAGTLTLGSALNIKAGSDYGVVTVANGAHLNTGNNLTLKSDVNGTASIGANTSGTAYIIGNVTAERYTNAGITAGRRAWRLMASPVTGITIHNAWQDSVNGGTATNPHPGYGTLITGEGLDASTAATLGFDHLGGGNHTSIKHYAIGGDPSNNGANYWLPLPNGSGTNNTLVRDEQAYLLFVRGNRSIGTSGTSTTNLRATGTLLQGTQTVPLSAASDYTLVGNPYAATIDFSILHSHNALIQDKFYLWSSKLGTYGAYVLVAPSNTTGYEATPAPLSGSLPGGNTYQYIPSESGFFVSPVTRNNNASPGDLVIEETDKAAGNAPPANPFRIIQATNVRQLLVNLNQKDSDTSATLADGFRAKFSDDYISNEEDNSSVKATNLNENLGLVRNNSDLIIEARADVKKTDTLFMKLWNVTKRNYQFQIRGDNFASAAGVQAWLEDSYLGTKQPVSLSGSITTVDFAVTSDSLSAKSDRFRIVFQNNAVVLPVTLTSIKAVPANGGVNVQWTVTSELNIKQYTVQRSTDGGRTYADMGTQAAKNNSAAAAATYNSFDAKPQTGDNLYRIRIEAKDGTISYSQAVNVTINGAGGSIEITLYPNPVRDGKVNLQMTNLSAGTYLVSVYTSGGGQTVYQKKITISQYNTTQSEELRLGTGIASGSYQFRVSDHKGAILFTSQLVVGK